MPWRKEWLPNPTFLPGEFHGQRSLGGYTPWGNKKLDKTEQLTFSLFTTLKNTSLFGSVHFSPSVMSDSATTWTAARQASLSYTMSWSWLKLRPIESAMPSDHLILIVPFSSCLQSFQALGSFPMSQLFASGGQSIGASASTLVLPVNIQGLFPLGWTGLVSLLSKCKETTHQIGISVSEIQLFVGKTRRPCLMSFPPPAPSILEQQQFPRRGRGASLPGGWSNVWGRLWLTPWVGCTTAAEAGVPLDGTGLLLLPLAVGSWLQRTCVPAQPAGLLRRWEG